MRADQLHAHAHALDLELDPATWDKIEELRGLWRHYGRSMNLTARLDDDALNTHIAESLQVVALAHRVGGFARWLDVGSGAGFPALVVAACLDTQLTCVEPRAKRASFLEIALRRVGRRDARVLRGRLEHDRWLGIEGDAPEPADVASARAVFEPREWLTRARAHVRPGGLVIVHLGVNDRDIAEPVARVDGERWSIRGYR